jgi:hypothetical protein
MVVSALATWDGKALAKGQKQISGFEKGVKSLGKSLGLAFGAAAIVKFGKNAAKAFIEDEKAASRLAQSVQNLGLAFETPRIERFISDLSAAAGVADDKLRPSMQKLLQVTGSVTKSQELLAQALDISRGSGVEYETVVADLSAAYVGNTKNLSKYATGLTKAELSAMSFADVQKELNNQFKGANAKYLTTYAGKMELLTTAAGEAKETIGKGLVDSLMILSGDTSVEELADSMQDLATNTSKVLTELAKLGKGVANFVSSGYGKVDEASNDITDFIDRLTGNSERIARRNVGRAGRLFGGGSGGQGFNVEDERARRKAEADAAKRAKELAAQKAKEARAEKQKLALTKASAAFDTTRISLAAALKATYDKETKLRLEALMLIEEDKGEAALKKIGELAAFQKNADMDKLKGVETISTATLESLNKQLLTELRVVNESRMAEGDKELAREEAFKKYNAAITAAGTLMAKEAYSERVQIQLTEIARLASISKTYNAAATSNLLLESSELSMIDRVAKAQALADAARMAALREYNNALNGVGGGGGGGGQSYLTATDTGPLGGLAAGVIAGVNPNFMPLPTLEDQPNYGWNPTMGFPGGSNVEITVNAGVGDPEAIARAVEDILNQSTYRGTSVNRGSGVYAV